MILEGVEIKWLGHDGFLIKTSSENQNSKKIYIDPYNIKELSDDSEKADLILITHSHYDSCSIADIKKLVKEGTKIICTADCQSKLTRLETAIKMEIIEPEKDIVFGNVKISALPAYNIGKHFHPKDEHWVGYLLKIGNVLIYHTGDTDFIPEMKNLTGYSHEGIKFVALLPVGGRLVMSVEEALEAAKVMKPDFAIPMHYGSLEGTDDDAKEFVTLCKEEGINAEILEKS